MLGRFSLEKKTNYHQRILKTRKGRPKPDYTMVLDAFSKKMEDTVPEQEPLCLDSTRYGNIARFLNHRCGDANLENYNVHIEYRSCQLYHVPTKLL
jgi:hypothetical protein